MKELRICSRDVTGVFQLVFRAILNFVNISLFVLALISMMVNGFG